MECKTAHPLLEAYLDGELDRAEARAVEAHLDTCAESREQLTRLDDLRRSLRDPALRHKAPDSLRRRIAASAAASRRSHASRWMSYAAACVLAFAAGGTAVHMAGGGNANAQVTRDLFASHWRALAATSPIDVVSTDRHTVKPWFAGKVAQTPVVQDFADRGFALIGGRLDYVGSSRVPVLVYKHGQHVIDVFVLPNGTSVASTTAQGYRLDSIEMGGQTAAVLSDVDVVEAEKLNVLLKGE